LTKLYKDRDWLFDQYINQKKSTPEIAKSLNVNRTTILNWLVKFNIPRRSYSEITKGKNNPSWKGGRKKHQGYWMVLKPEHPRAHKSGYVFEHIIIAEKMLGRPLKFYGINHKDNEVVHHIDCDKSNNNQENLYICTNSNHKNIHNKFGRSAKELYKLELIYFDKEIEEYFINYNKIRKRRVL